MNTGFEGIDDALNIEYEEDETLKSATEINTKLTNLITKSDSSDDEIDDKEYLELELKMLIQSTRNIMTVLEQDIKVGSKPRYHEVYATLTKTLIDGIKELRELNQSKINNKINRKKLEIKEKSIKNNLPQQTLNLQLSGSDLFKMLETAKSASTLNTVNADFEIVNEMENLTNKKLEKDDE